MVGQEAFPLSLGCLPHQDDDEEVPVPDAEVCSSSAAFGAAAAATAGARWALSCVNLGCSFYKKVCAALGGFTDMSR